MSTIEISPLPEGAVVRGILYDDPDMVYELGDVLDVELANGIHVDLEWNEEDKPMPFKITVWVGWFGNDIAILYVKTHEDAARIVSKVAMKYNSLTNEQIEELIYDGTIEEWR